MTPTGVKHPARWTLLFTLPFLVPACSDSPTDTDADGTLTKAEVLSLAGELGLESLAFGQSRRSAFTQGTVRRVEPSRTETVSVTYSLTRPCYLGGSVDSSGQIKVASDTATALAIVDITATDVHHSCVFPAGTTRVAVTGDPSVTTTIHAASQGAQSLGTQSVSVVGGLLFVTDDGRSGHCEIDILVEVNEETAYTSTRGQMCGFVFDVTVNG